MNRRRFTFWLGFGLFSLSEKLSISGLDGLAAAVMRRTDKVKTAAARTGGEHWAVGGNKEWRWFERENLVQGNWVLTGTTTPINKQTGERKPENIAYLDDSLVPPEVLASDKDAINLVNHADHEPADGKQAKHKHVIDLDPQLPTAEVRARHGRPPSKWLRSLHADEIRIWLKTVRLPEAEVIGMTVWTHLTRDHQFKADHIKGLTEDEQNKLHAAAHFGY